MPPTAFRTCPLCEATCGLALEVDAAAHTVTRVRGDAEDVFSRGFLCPKGVSLKELHDDPRRLRTPLVDGRPATWDAAFAVIAERLPAIQAEHGRDAVAAYVGNPAAHSLSFLLYGRVLLKALGTRNVFSASTVDQYPKQAASALMFGSGSAVPVPDLDRTRYLLVLGANPLASNGSLMTAPDARGRLRAIRARGGKVVVVDPRRTRTAKEADEHVPLRPGTDPLFLLALLHVVAEEGLVDLGACSGLADGVDALLELAAGFPPEAVAAATGVEAATMRRIARELAGAERAAVYGRIGTTTQAFGGVTSWLVDALNAITGNLDRPGGAMFTTPAAGDPTTRGEPGRGRGARLGRFHSRVRGLPETFGELPAACLAEEIDTLGPGQVRALITVAGNPVMSTPNSARLAAALESLDLMVSIDLYENETTRHADVVLPAPSPLEKAHFDLALYGFAVRNVANYSPPVLPLPEGMLDEWETVLRLTGVVTGQGPDADVAAIDDFVAAEMVRREVADAHSPLHGREAGEVLGELAPRRGPERLLDLLLRTGPYRLTLADLEAAPHGLDLGPLEPRLPGVLRTPTGRIDLAPAPLVAQAQALHALADAPPPELVLIGRRHLRSNNSWMNELPLLARGPRRDALLVSPADAARLGLQDGGEAEVASRVGSVRARVEVSDDLMPGVVSLPHGWSQTNSNVLSDELLVEPLTGTAVLNGIPVQVSAVREPAPALAG